MSSISQVLFQLTLFLSLFGTSVQVPAQEKSLPIQLQVPAQESRSAKLDNVAKGAVISLAAKANCEMWLDLKHQQTGERVFASMLPRTWNTVIRIPADGEYLLYFHNRGTESCGFNGKLHVRLAPESATTQLQRLSEELQKVFIIDPINYQLIDCNTANSYAIGSRVELCRQHLEALRDSTPEQQTAEDLILFMIMHETGHVLLTQWQYPFNSNEDVVDEFAVVLTRLMNRESAVEAQAAYFDKQPSHSEYEHLLNNDDRHTLSVQRARNLRGWARDSSLLRRWMPVLIPHLRSELLDRLKSSPDAKIAEMVASELKAR